METGGRTSLEISLEGKHTFYAEQITISKITSTPLSAEA